MCQGIQIHSDKSSKIIKVFGQKFVKVVDLINMTYKHLAFPTLVLSWMFDGQIITTPCNGPLINSLTLYVNFLMNSSSNGAKPTEDCCSPLRTMVINGMNCLCLIALVAFEMSNALFSFTTTLFEITPAYTSTIYSVHDTSHGHKY
ncbi:hypothetical protein T459_04984 [Capsicum annuum]|uniref:Bifunctional inhibitor/plant lipid transfer protein/seed storage helical domain-containing protein n=1 Tax=Capsicum annuum TaxID=4072 RepID=A0A2G3A6Q4_CAPAN|nr:hypothetical protein T459_04984 [Capsicum annuum]